MYYDLCLSDFDLFLDGIHVGSMSRDEVGVAARLISAEIYRRRPDLISEVSDDREAIEREAIEATKGELRMGDRMLADMNYEDIDSAALLLQRRIRELDEEFEWAHGVHDDAYYEDWLYEGVAPVDAAVRSAEEVAGLASGRIKRKPFFNPFAPGSGCNPFEYLANTDLGSKA